MTAGVLFRADTNIVTVLHVLVAKLFHVKRLDGQESDVLCSSRTFRVFSLCF